ncbi:MAG: hypothetical protein ACRDUA_02075 [Micromonosporaceae bacterium]
MTNRVTQLLTAYGPDPAYQKELDLYGRFVGTWQVANRIYDEVSGAWRQNTREWAFGWVLNGLGIQDVLRSDDGGIGTTIRVYDPDLGAWRVHWFGASARYFGTQIGRPHGDGIRQEGTRHDGRVIRWEFSEITDARFLWRGYLADEPDGAWHLVQEMRATR